MKDDIHNTVEVGKYSDKAVLGNLATIEKVVELEKKTQVSTNINVKSCLLWCGSLSYLTKPLYFQYAYLLYPFLSHLIVKLELFLLDLNYYFKETEYSENRHFLE